MEKLLIKDRYSSSYREPILLQYNPISLRGWPSRLWSFTISCSDLDLTVIRSYHAIDITLAFTWPTIQLTQCSIEHFAQLSPLDYPWQNKRQRGHLAYDFVLRVTVHVGVMTAGLAQHEGSLYTLARSTYRRPSLLRPLSPAEQAIFQPYGSRYA
jgi:hypothetical protein